MHWLRAYYLERTCSFPIHCCPSEATIKEWTRLKKYGTKLKKKRIQQRNDDGLALGLRAPDTRDTEKHQKWLLMAVTIFGIKVWEGWNFDVSDLENHYQPQKPSRQNAIPKPVSGRWCQGSRKGVPLAIRGVSIPRPTKTNKNQQKPLSEQNRSGRLRPIKIYEVKVTV